MAETNQEDTDRREVEDLPQIYIRPVANDPFRQGEILRSVHEWTLQYNETNTEMIEGYRPIEKSLAVIVTQDCDLAQDFRERKDSVYLITDLRSVLLCQVELADEIRSRDRLESKTWKRVRQNKIDRYHYLDEVPKEADFSDAGQEPMAIDFKRFFSVATVELYRQDRRSTPPVLNRFTRLRSPWRDHLMHRFAYYLSRVGLPRDHFIPDSRRGMLPA